MNTIIYTIIYFSMIMSIVFLTTFNFISHGDKSSLIWFCE